MLVRTTDTLGCLLKKSTLYNFRYDAYVPIIPYHYYYYVLYTLRTKKKNAGSTLLFLWPVKVVFSTFFVSL